MNEKFGQGIFNFLPECAETPNGCPFEPDYSCFACLDSDYSDKRSNPFAFNPDYTNMDVNAFRESVSNRCEASWTDINELHGVGGVTERFAEAFTSFDLYVKTQPNFGMDFIVDCNGRQYNRRTCSSMFTQVEGVELSNCMDAAEYLICLAPGVVDLAGEFSIDGDASSLSYDFDFSCEFFQNLETEMCLAATSDNDEGGSWSYDPSLDAGCSSGEVMNCVEPPYSSCLASSKVGDGSCDPSLNCRRFNYDGGDCEDWAPSTLTDANGDPTFCDCHGNCSPKSICQTWGLTDCSELYDYYAINLECDASLDCKAFSYDGGDCGGAPAAPAPVRLSSKNSTANNLWLEEVRILLIYIVMNFSGLTLSFSAQS